MKTFHEVVDEIYYKVDNLEPWERGTRKTAGMSEFLQSLRCHMVEHTPSLFLVDQTPYLILIVIHIYITGVYILQNNPPLGGGGRGK